MTAERFPPEPAADIAPMLLRPAGLPGHNLAPTTSSLMMLALGDAPSIAVGRPRHSVDFSVLHPGGVLGADAETIPATMHAGGAVPLKLSARCPRRWSR